LYNIEKVKESLGKSNLLVWPTTTRYDRNGGKENDNSIEMQEAAGEQKRYLEIMTHERGK
jgi:hypothetical protein